MRTARDGWRPWRRAALAALVPVTAVILAGTLGAPEIAERACLALLEVAALLTGGGVPTGYDEVQAVANVVMFVPLGALSIMGTRPAWWPVVAPLGPLLSMAVERLQQAVPGRVPDALDVAANSTGSLLGVLAGGAVVGALGLVTALHRLVARPAPTAAG